MNKCLAAGWLVFIFISALTESFHDMIVTQTMAFRFTPHPDASGFFVFDMRSSPYLKRRFKSSGTRFPFLCSPVCFSGSADA